MDGDKYTMGFRSLIALLWMLLLAGCGPDASGPVKVKLMAINDFHGYLLPSSELTLNVPDLQGGPDAEVYVGGAAYLATLIKNTREQHPATLFVGVGDLLGGAPAVASWTLGEATIEAMNLMDLEVSAVGNHEFDAGKAELLRMQRGGCAPASLLAQNANWRSCARGEVFKGAQFPYLAANVIDNDTGQTLFPSTHLRRVNGAAIGFVGLTLKDTPQTTRGADGLTFTDEVSVINQGAQRLRSQGADAVVVLLHQGGATNVSSFKAKACPAAGTAIHFIVSSLSSQVDIVLSAHTHYDYICEINGILLTQASSYGRVVTEIDLLINPGSGVMSKTAMTVPVINDLTTRVPQGYTILQPDVQVQKLVNFYDELTAPARSAAIGYISSAISRVDIDGSGALVASGTRVNVADHPIGRLVADAFVQATGPTGETPDLAFINPGGLRNYLPYKENGKVDYEALFAVLPFGDALFMVDMTGSALIRLLEQQWEKPNCSSKTYQGICGRVLQTSSSLQYSWVYDSADQGKPTGQGAMVVIDSVRVNGQPLDLNKTYKIATVEFLASDGGDNFSVFVSQGKNVRNLATSALDAVIAYFKNYADANNRLPVPVPRVSCRLKDGSVCNIPVL